LSKIKTWSTPLARENSSFVPCALCCGKQFKSALLCEGFAYARCVSCGLVQINPQPDTSSVITRYTDAYGKDYCAYELANEENFLRLQLLALEDAGFFSLEQQFFQNTLAPSVFDIGCATGSLLHELEKRGWQCYGVEISPAAGYARSKYSLDVRSLPLEQNGFATGSFDVILASHLLEHLNDPGGILSEIYRLLKDRGRVFITTPNISGFQARIFRGAWRSAIFDHLYLFSVKTLTALLRKSGFSVECIRTWGGLAEGAAPAWLKRFADRIAKKLGQGDVMIIRACKKTGN
jgi:SAM-dependent methyltransferase